MKSVCQKKFSSKEGINGIDWTKPGSLASQSTVFQYCGWKSHASGERDGNLQHNRVVASSNPNAPKSTSATAFISETNFDSWLKRKAECISNPATWIIYDSLGL